MDQGLYTGAIYLDLRKAFDVVNYDLLLQLYGCSSSALLWFKSYLSDRRQCVNIAGTLSYNEAFIYLFIIISFAFYKSIHHVKTNKTIRMQKH